MNPTFHGPQRGVEPRRQLAVSIPLIVCHKDAVAMSNVKFVQAPLQLVEAGKAQIQILGSVRLMGPILAAFVIFERAFTRVAA